MIQLGVLRDAVIPAAAAGNSQGIYNVQYTIRYNISLCCHLLGLVAVQGGEGGAELPGQRQVGGRAANVGAKVNILCSHTFRMRGPV